MVKLVWFLKLLVAKRWFLELLSSKFKLGKTQLVILLETIASTCSLLLPSSCVDFLPEVLPYRPSHPPWLPGVPTGYVKFYQGEFTKKNPHQEFLGSTIGITKRYPLSSDLFQKPSSCSWTLVVWRVRCRAPDPWLRLAKGLPRIPAMTVSAMTADKQKGGPLC